MRVQSIGLIAAMPEEITPLLSSLGSVTTKTVGGFQSHAFKKGGHDIVLLLSGIGAARAKEATRVLIEFVAPDIILNFGFGGAVLQGPAVGDIVVAERLFSFEAGKLSERTELIRKLTPEMAIMLEQRCLRQNFSIHSGAFVTSREIIGKPKVLRILPASTTNPVLEMETAAVAEAALDLNVPVAALRAISDGADENIDFTMMDIADREMQIRLRKVLWMVVRKPSIIPQLLRLWGNSRRAAKSLAVAVIAFIDGVGHPD